MNYVAAARAELIRALGDRAEGCSRQLIDAYTLLVLVKGTACSLADIHDAWAIAEDGRRADHPALIPFDELTTRVQALDAPYRAAVIEAAARLAL